MAGVNEILPFAFLVNANIITQTEYQSASWRPGGFVQGVAISPQLNKVWHQGSFVASALGQFIADNNIDVRDDGDVVGLAGKIASAIRAIGGGPTGPSGPIGVPDAPGMDGILYGLRNRIWTQVITLADVQGLLAGYIPITGGQMLTGGSAGGFLTLAQAPVQGMHAVNLAYMEQRISDIVAGQGGGFEDAPGTALTYGRQGNPRGWQPVVRADQFSVIDPGPLRIRSNFSANNIPPSLELQNSSLVDAEGIWRINVGVAGNWNLQHWDGAGWETEVGVGRTAKGIFAPRGGIVTGSGIIPELDRAEPGSFQAFATVTENYPTSQDYPEVILGNLGTIAGPYNEGFPRYGKWRMCVGAGGNLNFHHNTTWDNWGDFSTCEAAFTIRHGAAAVGVEVYGNLQCDNDLILGRASTDAWIVRPDQPGQKNLDFGTWGGGLLDTMWFGTMKATFANELWVSGLANVYYLNVWGGDLWVRDGSMRVAHDIQVDWSLYTAAHVYVNGAIYFKWDGSQGYIDCTNGAANLGSVYCRRDLMVNGPATFYIPGANDPVTVYCDAGLYARIRYSHINVDLWSEGLTRDGQFMIADDGRAMPRMLIDPLSSAAGDVSFWGLMHANSGLWVHTLELGVNGAFVARVDRGCELYGDTTVFGPFAAIGYRNGYCIEARYGIWCNTIVHADSMSADGDIYAGNIVTAVNGVNVHNGKLWVSNAMEAYTWGGGHLVNSWYTDYNFTVYGTFEAVGRTYLDGHVDCWADVYINNGLNVTGGITIPNWGSLTIINGDIQIHRGTAYKPDGGPWNNIYSSIEVKKQVVDYRSGLDELCRLRPVSYQFNGLAGSPDDGKTYYGILAEEALEIMPELKVGETLHRTHAGDTEETPYASLNSGPVIWALVNAVKELAAKVEALEARGG